MDGRLHVLLEGRRLELLLIATVFVSVNKQRPVYVKTETNSFRIGGSRDPEGGASR
jgi:hypothetical protein